MSKMNVLVSNNISILEYEVSAIKVHVPRKINEDFIFEPVNIENCEIFASIHSPNQISNTNSEHFIIYVYNFSNSSINFKHGQVIGHISSIDKIDFSEIGEVEPQTEQCNLIQASQHVLNLRKQQLQCNDFDTTHLSAAQREHILNILMQNYAAFSKDLQTLGHTDKVIPQLSFLHNYPIKCLPFPIPQALHKQAIEQLNELESAGIIERANTEWACPMLFVKKKPVAGEEQKFRMALDLRLINNIIKCSTYPLPKISDIISNLSSFKYYTVLDLSNAYWQVDLPEKYRHIIAFTTPWGCFRFNRLAQGLKTSSSWFQSMIDTIIHETALSGLFSYQDDLVIASNSFEEMVYKLNVILLQLSKNNITASPSKCVFFKQCIDYLGFHVSHANVKPVKSNIIKITSFPVPKTKRQTKRFIGICGYYRNLLPRYAELIQPLIDISKPKATFKWTQKENLSFDTLQKLFFSEPFVRQPQWDNEFIVNTDASSTAISGILMQEFDGVLHPISYYSKTLSAAEKRYPSIKLELMGIYKSVTAFKYYLYNRQFTILTDSKPLLHYKKTSIPTDITTRWLLELSQYSMNFKHIPGKENLLADYFSRLPETPPHIDITQDKSLLQSKEILPVIHHSEDDEYLINAINNSNTPVNVHNNDPLLEISPQTILQEQLNDNKISKIYNSVSSNQFNKTNSNYFIHPCTKLLYFNQSSKSDYNPYINPNVIILPTSLHAKALSIAHLPHYGIHKTYDFLRNNFFWYGMYSDTVNYVKSCHKCVINKHPPIPHAPLQSAPVYNKPGMCVSLDILGPLSNNQYILTVIDHFTKHLELYPLTKITANNVTDCLFDYISTHGRPSTVLTDLGSQFVSQVFTKFNQVLGIKINHSTVAHPQSNTSAERPNKLIKSTVEALMKQGFPFLHAIRIHKMLYNASKHTTTENSPNLIHFGRSLSLLFDTYNHDLNATTIHQNDYINNVLKSMQSIYDQTTSNIMSKQINQNIKFNAKTKLRHFNVRDVVYLKSREKFNQRLDGPFSILEKHNDVNYTIQLLDNPHAQSFKVHVDRLHYVEPRRPLLQTPLFKPQVNFPVSGNTVPHNYFLRSRY